MRKQSAGILVHRLKNNKREVFLIHMGGPFWANKDEGGWSIPKGELQEQEDALSAARREFLEETGFNIEGDFIPLNPVRQSSGKIIYSWAVEGEFEASAIKSNLFEIEWPPKSGKMQSFPEADRAEWFTLEKAKTKILKYQQPLIDELIILLKINQ